MKLFGAARRVPGMEVVEAWAGTGGATGIVPWASRARRFGANLLAMEKRWPEGAALVRAAAAGGGVGGELGRYELHLAGDGNFQVLDTTVPLRQGWLAGLADHKAATRLWPYEVTTPQFLNPIAFDGLGFGWLFQRARADDCE